MLYSLWTCITIVLWVWMRDVGAVSLGPFAFVAAMNIMLWTIMTLYYSSREFMSKLFHPTMNWYNDLEDK